MQPKTTVRNNQNAGFRVIVDALTRASENALGFKNPIGNGTFDLVKAIFTPYESMVLKKLMQQQFPQESARLFRQAADIESATTETVLSKLGRKMNLLNTYSDNFWKSNVISASLTRQLNEWNAPLSDAAKRQILINRIGLQMGDADNVRATQYLDSLTKKQYDDLLKEADLGEGATYNLKNTIYSGQFDLIPEEFMTKAFAEAYDFVYQTEIKGNTYLGKFAKGFIKAHGDYPFVISTFMPFPRFIASQLKFLNDHMPLIPFITRGLNIDRAGMKNPEAYDWFDANWKFTPEGKKLFSKQTAGTMALLTAYAWRVKQGDTNYFYEMKDSQGNLIDGRAFYGPFLPYMLVADTIYRYQTDSLPQNKFRRFGYDALQSLFGSTFRTGFGLYAMDKMFDDLATGDFERAIGSVVGDIIAAFNIPFQIVGDIYGTFDKESRKIKETRFGTDTRRVIGDEPFVPDLGDRMINLLDAMYYRATRNLPDLPLKSWGESIGIPTDYLPERDYGRPARSAFQTGDLTRKEMIRGQVTGFNLRNPKNEMQKEMGRLNLMPIDIYRRDSDELIDMYTRYYLSEEGLETNLNVYMENFVMRSDEYRDAPIETKRNIFLRESKVKINEAKEFAKAQIEFEQEEMNKELPIEEQLSYSQVDIAAWNKVPRGIKKRIQEEYENNFLGEGSILADRDRKTFIVGGYRISPLLWGLDRFKQLRGTSGDL